MKPEVRFCFVGSEIEAFVNCVHGDGKSDWETVWFLALKMNVTTSPIAAVIFAGS